MFFALIGGVTSLLLLGRLHDRQLVKLGRDGASPAGDRG
jgi:hypothetical protein